MFIGTWLIALVSCVQGAAAEDRVELLTGKEERSAAFLRGEIVEIIGGQVRVRRADGREDVVPWSRVKKIETTWPEGTSSGDALLMQGKHAAAVEAYRAASAKDARGWVKRDLAARACVAFREQNEIKKAGELFLSIYKSDPATPHWDVVPLAWKPQSADRALESVVAQWSNSTDSPPAVLLGASWQIAFGNHAGVVESLQSLTTNRDVRIALLAEAQLWRVRLATAAESDVESWERTIRRMPMPMRAGPYFVVGQAWARLNQHDRAALAWMRIPVEYVGQRALAVESLERAAEQLDRINQTDEAARLRRERAGLVVDEMTP